MQPLPVRPRPAPEESLPGYATRLARVNGWPSGDALCRALGIRSRPHDPRHACAVLDAVHEWTGHDLALAQFYPDGQAEYLYDAHRAVRSLAVPDARICPVCMDGEPLAQGAWTVLPFTHCPHHREPLLRQCPHCGERFGWEARLLGSGCPGCATPWRAMARGAEPCAYLEHLIGLTVKERQPYLRDLAAAAVRALRPYDALLDHLAQPPAINNWSEVLTTAYAMLTDHAFLADWARSCWQERASVVSAGPRAVLAPIYGLVGQLEGQWPIQEWDLGAFGREEQASSPCLASHTVPHRPKRKLYKENEEFDVSARFQTDLHGMAQVIGCHAGIVTDLVERGALPSLNAARQSRDALWDLRALSAVLSALPEVERHTERSLASWRAHFPLFAVTDADVLQAVVSGDVPARLDTRGDTVMDGIVVGPYRLVRFLRRSLEARALSEAGVLNADDARAVLGVSEAEFDLLTRSGHMPCLPWQRTGDRYHVRDILAVLRTYCVAPRTARIRGLRKAALRAHLEERGFQPELGRSFYRWTAALRAAIRSASLK